VSAFGAPAARAGGQSGSPGRAGFTLVELLVAAAIAAVTLAAAWGWLWNVAGLSAKVDEGTQATTTAASVARAVAADVRAAAAAAVPAGGQDPSRALVLRHDHVDVAPEDVLIAWDPARHVVWRNAPGTYLADHVTRFSVAYVLGDGRRLHGADMDAPDWPAVRLVCIDLRVEVGSGSAARAVTTAMGPL
jgi:prepilin-type N-terminal cleavage/methylation domain-containing protein